MKFRESGSISDTECLNLSENTENDPLESAQIKLSDIKAPPFKETEMSILSLGSPRLSGLDPASHDKVYYDDRFNESAFDPFLARSSLPKIFISIGGMLLTGFFLNIIIVSKLILNITYSHSLLDMECIYKCTRIVRTRSGNL